MFQHDIPRRNPESFSKIGEKLRVRLAFDRGCCEPDLQRIAMKPGDFRLFRARLDMQSQGQGFSVVPVPHQNMP